jgi:SAM-dependent methyltransferase
MEINKNKALWDGNYAWSNQGEEWSASWGNSQSQWFSCIFPRIQRFLPCANILEIACGYGRWTHYLKDYAAKLYAIDLSEECINVSKERFSCESGIEFFLNDGKSLEMVAPNSIDLVFSFDSLVHANTDTLQAYLLQLDRILTKDGVAFIHHSNLRAISDRIGEEKNHLRDPGVDASVVESLCAAANLSCITQELVNWGVKSLPLDCFSTITKAHSKFDRENKRFENPDFMEEARLIRQLSALYTG